MGESKEKVSRPFWISRLILAGTVFLVGFVAILQFIIPSKIVINFNTGSGAQQLSAIHVKKGEEIELPTPLKSGSYFVGWSTDKDSANIVTDVKNIKKGTTLYAVWDGVEKYGILMVNGVVHDNVNIFLASDVGVSPTELNKNWVLYDDFNNDGTGLKKINDNRSVVLKNNYQRFLGWEFLNKEGRTDKLLYNSGNWTLQTASGDETQITETSLFYPPNYKTTFNAILEYRKINFLFYNYGESNAVIAPPVSDVESYAPQYSPNEADSTPKFSHWEIEAGNLMKYAPQGILEQIKTRTFVPGEKIVTDPLWYFFGTDSELSLQYGSDTVIATLVIRAKEWETPIDKYTMQIVSDTSDGKTKISIPEAPQSELNLQNPVVYYNNSLWIYKDAEAQITTYNFIDHNGVIHQIPTIDLNSSYTEIKLGGTYNILGRDITFNSNRAINVTVNFRSALKNISLNFNYGKGIYVLPEYKLSTTAVKTYRTVNIGNRITLPNAEKYIKTDSLFYGWKLEGDVSGRIYYAGEYYTIPNLQTNIMEFTAVWREARLLYDFDFNGGQWEKTPDFTIMKGAFGNRVKIVSDVPVKFGYNFAGWLLNGTLRQPGESIVVGDDIQIMYAQWTPKKLEITYYYYLYGNSQSTKLITVSGSVESSLRLPMITSNSYLKFDGWQIGDDLYPSEAVISLDISTIAKLNPVPDGDILKLEITAKQTTMVAVIEYYGLNGKITNPDWKQNILQGEKFSQYAPFSTGHQGLDMGGQEFIGWEFSVNTSQTRNAIKESTIVPNGATTIKAYSTYEPKNFIIEYLGFNDEVYCPVDKIFEAEPCQNYVNSTRYSYSSTINLLKRTEISPLPPATDAWGTFIGWSFEKDYTDSNPSIIYEVLENESPVLQLVDTDNMFTNLSDPYYKINIDKHGTKIGDTFTYKISLHAVYARDSVKISYQGVGEYEAPIFVGDNRDKAMMGGTTIGSQHKDFDTYGIMVWDDFGLEIDEKYNFVGWQIQVPDGIPSDVKEQLINKIWFPGEMLPSVDFDINFVPVLVVKNSVENIHVGTSTYRVASLGSISNHKIDNVDIVVLPKGDYTVNTSAIDINGSVQKIVISANGNITLLHGAIKSNSIKEFYVSDNLILQGSPVVGNNIKKFSIKKGYLVWDSLNREILPEQDSSLLYNYDASILGLLIKDNTLVAVPANTQIGTDGLYNALIKFGINRISSYALNEINSLNIINLSIENLQLDNKAIFTTTASQIILPKFSNSINEEFLSGYQYKLSSVKFENDDKSNYAFVDSGIVYFGSAKSHIVYVLPSASTRNLDYTTKDLLIPASVTRINDYALSSRNWSQINSITADASIQNMNIAELIGIPDTLPIFVNLNNTHIGGMMQTYQKIFSFTFTSQDSVDIVFKYGQDFTVFDPKEENQYNIKFDKPWHKFVGWTNKNNSRLYKTGEVYKVGIDSNMLVNSSVILDASGSVCWVSYPVKFHICDATTQKDVEVNIKSFINDYGVSYTFEEVINNNSLLSQLYLPGVDLSFSHNGKKYQFVGWTSRTSAPSFIDGWLWNNNQDNRILPNGTTNTKLNSGTLFSDAYVYFALYDLVTDNLSYEIEDSKFTVSYNGTKKDADIRIPYAKYNGRFMAPVMKVKANSFNDLQHITGEIVIGAAVSEIGDNAFSGVNANINFMHKGQNIKINNDSSNIYQLKIGNNAFSKNSKITDITLPAVMNELGDYAFANCGKLIYQRLETGSMLNRLGKFVFQNDEMMNSNEIATLIEKDTLTTRKIDQIGEGIFMKTSMNKDIIWIDTLIHAGGSSGKVSVTKNIKGYAFAGNSKITDIIISNSSLVVGENAFSYLSSSVISIDLTKTNVNKVADNAFQYMPKLSVKVSAPVSAWTLRFPTVKDMFTI